MLITQLHSKIAYATITQVDLFYEGSITIDEDMMDQSGIREHEQVHIVNINNGERLVTYVIKGERGSKIFGLNGPAARKGCVGDQVHILSYVQVDAQDSFTPIVLDLGRKYPPPCF